MAFLRAVRLLLCLSFCPAAPADVIDEHGMPGAVHRVGFDNWYPGFLDFTHIFRNSISFFTETALYSYATPHFYSVNDFPRERQGLRLRAQRRADADNSGRTCRRHRSRGSQVVGADQVDGNQGGMRTPDRGER